jgi:hypothetical protein
MDIYHIWCDLKPGVYDMEFVENLRRYLDKLQTQGELVTYRITRAKLGFKPPQLRDFHITLEFRDLTQLQTAFDHVASRTDPIESLHQAVNSKVQDIYFALYRDFPDSTRLKGEEKF